MFKKIIEPRVSETDGARHINNTTIPIWFEAGRNEIFRLFIPDLSFNKWNMVIVSLNVNYVSQIYYGYDVTVLTWLKRIGNSSFELYEEIHQSGKLCATGTATYVNFNFEKQKSEPIPDEIRTQLELHLYHEEQSL